MSDDKILVKKEGVEALDTPSAAAAAAPSGKPEKPVTKKKLTGPFISICLGALVWVYSFVTDLLGQLETLYNSAFGTSANTTSGSDFVVGGADNTSALAPTAIIFGIFAVAALLVIFGFISLFKRAVNNAKVK